MRLMLYVVILSLAGCSATQLKKVDQVLVTIRADAKTVIVTGCQGLPSAEVAMSVVQPFVPPGSTTSAVVLGVSAGEAVATALCAQVKAAQPPVTGVTHG